MATFPSPIDLSTLPADLVRAVALDAARDAESVAHFLDALGKTSVGRWLSQKPVRLPANFLLGLGAALRLLTWEQQGIQVHREAGLPSAREALRDAFHAVTDPEAATRTQRLTARVLRLFVEHFAWNGRLELDAEVTLGEAEEELVLDTLADFLWAHRPR